MYLDSRLRMQKDSGLQFQTVQQTAETYVSTGRRRIHAGMCEKG